MHFDDLEEITRFQDGHPGSQVLCREVMRFVRDQFWDPV